MDDALEHANGELTTDDVYNYLLSERMFLFVVKDPYIRAAAVCEVVQYVRKKAIRVVTLGGEDFARWGVVLNEALREWADKIQADGVEAYVRKGLVPKLEHLGYQQKYYGMWLDYGKR